MSKYVYVFIFAAATAFVGCAAADRAFNPDPVTGKSPAQTSVEVAQPFLPPPYGEIGLGAIIAIQNAYLAFRKYQEKKADGTETVNKA